MRTGHKGNLKFIFWDGASSLTLPTHSSLCWQKVLTKTKIWPSLSAWELCFLHPLQNEIQPLTWLAGHFPAGPHTASPASHLWRPWAPVVLISSWLASSMWDHRLEIHLFLSSLCRPLRHHLLYEAHSSDPQRAAVSVMITPLSSSRLHQELLQGRDLVPFSPVCPSPQSPPHSADKCFWNVCLVQADDRAVECLGKENPRQEEGGCEEQGGQSPEEWVVCGNQCCGCKAAKVQKENILD